MSILLLAMDALSAFFTGLGNTTSTGAAPEFTALNVNTDGTITSSKSASGSWTIPVGQPLNGSWTTPTGGTPGNNFWVRVTATSGAFTSGDTAGSWLALSSNRSWRITQAVSGSSAVTCTVEIAADSGGAAILCSQAGVVVTAVAP